MNILKKKLVTYKKLIICLVTNQQKDGFKLTANVKSSAMYYKNIKFEIKLYLIGLSFNRFIFNFDKMLFVLCIITNFLYFLSFQSPRVLFVGEVIDKLSFLYESSAKNAGQLYFRKVILPGSITKIKMVELFYESAGKALFTKHIDCIFAFFCNPIKQILSEIKVFSIPIIALVEFNAEDVGAVTYPIICPYHYSSISFFTKYFTKILNVQRLTPKITFYTNTKTSKNKKGFKIKKINKRFFSKEIKKKKFLFFIKNTSNSLKYILYGLVMLNKFLFFFYNRFFLNLLGLSVFTKNYLKFYNTSFFRFFYFLKFLISSSNNQLKAGNKLKKFKKMYLAYKKMGRPPWWKPKYKNKNKSNKNKKSINKAFLLKLKKTKKKLRSIKLFKSVKKKMNKLKKKKKFNRIKWAKSFYNWLLKHNIYANVSLTNFEKPLFFRDYIIQNLKNHGITTGFLRRKMKCVVNPWYPYIGTFDAYIKRKLSRKNFKPKERRSARDIPGTWEYKKWRLFTPMDIPKKRKKLKKLKFAWALRRLVGLNKNNTPQRFLSKFRPRASILKKKILVKKLVYYYYSFSLKKKLRILLKYNRKNLSYRTVDTTKNLMNIFSLHLCIFVLRSRLASNISKAKSLITKGNIFVNGKAIYNPGYILKDGDIIQMGYFSAKEFLRRVIHSDKPKRFKKKRFFFKLSTRGILSKRVLSLQLLNFSFKAFYKHYNTYFKHYWKKRTYSYSFFKNYFKNFTKFQF